MISRPDDGIVVIVWFLYILRYADDSLYIGETADVPIETLLAYLERGRPLAEFLADFPTVTEEQAVAVLEEAKEALLARVQRPARSAR